MYYNWDGAMVLLLLDRLAGIRYSIPDDTLTVCEHLPTEWDDIETRVPIVVRGETRWTTIRTTRRERNGRVRKRTSIRGCPLKRLVVQPWLEGRRLLATEPAQHAAAPRGHAGFTFQDVADQTVTVVLEGEGRGPTPTGTEAE